VLFLYAHLSFEQQSVHSGERYDKRWFNSQPDRYQRDGEICYSSSTVSDALWTESGKPYVNQQTDWNSR